MGTILIIALLLIVISLVFTPKVRDYFISGKIFLQILWLFLIIAGIYISLMLIQEKFGFVFNRTHGLPFHFINSNISSEDIADTKWNTNLTYGFVVAFLGSILIGGVLISIFTSMLDRRIRNIEKGLVSYRFKNHILLIGFDDIAIGLIRQNEKNNKQPHGIKILYSWLKRIFHNDRCYLIQTTQNVEDIRHQLLSNLPDDIIHRIYILYKHLDSEKDLRKLYVNSAKKIFVVGEQNSVDHDAVVIKTVHMLAEYRKNNPKDTTPLECHVLFEYQATCSIFQNKEISAHLKNYVDIRPFNFYELWAQKLFIKSLNAKRTSELISYPGLDFEPIPPSCDKQVTLVIVGMSRMGIALAVKAMQICHYANYERAKTRIIFIDPDMEQQRNIFESRYSALMDSIDVIVGYDNTATFKAGKMSNYTDIALQFINDRIETPACRQFLSEIANDESKLLTLAICLNDPPISLAIGLYLPDSIYYTKTNILIRQETSESILQTMEIEDMDKYKNVYPFGMKSDCYDMELNDDLLPKLVHSIYCNSFEYDIESEENEFSVKQLNKNWSKLIVKHKWSNYCNAEHFPTKIKMIREDTIKPNDIIVTEDDIALKKDLLARIEHNRWVIEKLLVGFRKATSDEIAELKKRKESFYKQKREYRQMLLRKQEMKCANQLDVFVSLEKDILNQKDKCENLRQEIKEIKKVVEGAYRHDCLVPFEDLNKLDKYTDYVIVESVPWIQKWMSKNTQN